ncbi:hypothetical protein ACFQ3Z_39170 [Streptomyces nogalater]
MRFVRQRIEQAGFLREHQLHDRTQSPCQFGDVDTTSEVGHVLVLCEAESVDPEVFSAHVNFHRPEWPLIGRSLTREQGPEAPDLFHKARHSLPRHGDEGRVLVPAFVAGIDVPRMLNQCRGDDVSMIEVRPPLGGTSVGSRAHRHEIHGGVIVQGPDEPRRRSGRRAQLLDLIEFLFTHVATFHQPVYPVRGAPQP